MNISILKSIAKLFSSYTTLKSIQRVQENLFKLTLDKHFFYISTKKRASEIFCTSLSLKEEDYHAPFDLFLKKIRFNTILSCSTDGENRILVFSLKSFSSYKTESFFLYFELTGRHTNVIITDPNSIILEALHHLNTDKTSRPIKVGQILKPLPQPTLKQNVPSKQIQGDILSLLYQKGEELFSQTLSEKKNKILGALEGQKKKLLQILHSLPDEKYLTQQKDILIHQAQTMLAHLGKIPPYAQQIELLDFNNEILKIQIKTPMEKPQDLVNTLFKESKQMARKLSGIHLQKQNLTAKIDFLNKQINFATQTQNLEFLNILINKSSKGVKNTSQNSIGKSFFLDGYKISIGRNQKENQLILQYAKSQDIWLHLKDIPSAHMIIHSGKHHPSVDIIEKCAQILLGLTTTQRGKFEVDYTRRKFVKIKQKAQVVYSKHKTIILKN